MGNETVDKVILTEVSHFNTQRFHFSNSALIFSEWLHLRSICFVCFIFIPFHISLCFAFICLAVFVVYLLICLSIYLSIDFFIYLIIHFCLNVSSFAHLFGFSVCLFDRPFVRSFFSLFNCLFVWFFCLLV